MSAENPWNKYYFAKKGTDEEIVEETTASFNVRYIEMDKDISIIKTMTTEYTFKIFGLINIEDLLWKSFFTVCCQDDSEKPVAYLSVNVKPNLLTVPSDDWENWVQNLYGLDMLNSWNTLWINFHVSKQDEDLSFLSMAQFIFISRRFVEYLIMVVPSVVRNLKRIEQYGTKILPKDNKTQNCMYLFLFSATKICNPYILRKTVQEDNDNLVEMFEGETRNALKIYGNYFFAEILTQHKDSGRQIITAESNKRIMGMVLLNENVNTDYLSQEFELTCYFGLRKISADRLIYTETSNDNHENSSTYGNNSKTSDNHKEQDLVSQELRKFNSNEKQAVTSFSDSEDTFVLENISSLHLKMSISEESLTSDQKFSQEVLFFTEKLFDNEGKISYKSIRFLPDPSPFEGEPNAFAIELIRTLDSRAIFKLLQCSFECFPNRDFAVVSTPPTCYNHPLLRFFSQAPHNAVSNFNHCLYIIHRDMLSATPSVRKATIEDYTYLKLMVQQIPKRQGLLQDFANGIDDKNKEYFSYVLQLNDKKIVGVAVIRKIDDILFIRELFDLTNTSNERMRQQGPFGIIEELLISPVFSKMSRFFLREIHRHSDFDLLFYFLHYRDCKKSPKDRPRVINNVLDTMVPARVKKIPEIIDVQSDKLEMVYKNRLKYMKSPKYVLFVSSLKICSRPKYEVNVQIVVVGASETAISFLEGLLCTWTLKVSVKFTNITVISPDHLITSDLDNPNSPKKIFFPAKSISAEKQSRMINIRSYINHVSGVMTAIDRKNKTLVVNYNSCIKYDFLYILDEEEFQKPTFDPHNIMERPKEIFPDNVYIVNTETEAETALNHLSNLIRSISERSFTDSNSQKTKSFVESSHYYVIVYGAAIEAYCCLAALMESGIPGPNLILVEPPAPPLSEVGKNIELIQEPFDDINVFYAVCESLKQNGIEHCQNSKFVEWNYDPDTNLIREVIFKTKTHIFSKSCIAMFMFNLKAISYRTFMAINKAGIVFDGGIVIDSKNRTNDPSIYAAGTNTKYSRKYYAENLSHRYFNLEEIGYDLGTRTKSKLLEIVSTKYVFDTSLKMKCREDGMIPTFSKPILTHCKLPGGLWYFNVSKPGRKISKVIAETSNEYGLDLITGDCKSLNEKGYFKIHLDVHGCIETITCLSKFEIDKINLTSLWGKHERMLNKLLLRYEMGLIDDFYKFLRQPWACAVYEDDFQNFFNKVVRILHYSAGTSEEKSFAEEAAEWHRNMKWKQFSDNDYDEMDETFSKSDYPTLIEEEVLQYLQENQSVLPMYFNEINESFLTPSSPLFEPK